MSELLGPHTFFFHKHFLEAKFSDTESQAQSNLQREHYPGHLGSHFCKSSSLLPPLTTLPPALARVGPWGPPTITVLLSSFSSSSFTAISRSQSIQTASFLFSRFLGKNCLHSMNIIEPAFPRKEPSSCSSSVKVCNFL